MWIELNSVRQLSSYHSLVKSRWPQVNEDIREGSNEESSVMQSRNGHTKLDGDESTGLAVLKGFDTNAALQLLEQEIKEVVCLILSLGNYYVLIIFYTFLRYMALLWALQTPHTILAIGLNWEFSHPARKYNVSQRVLIRIMEFLSQSFSSCKYHKRSE